MMPAALMMMGATPSSMDPQSMTTSAFMPDVDGNTDAQALSLSVNAALSAESTALADAQVTDESATDKICALNQPSSSSSSSLASHSTIADEGGQSSQSSGITNDYLAALKAAVAEEAPHNLRTPPATPGNREFTSDPSAVVDSMGVLFSAATEALGTKAQDEQTLHNLQQHQQQHQQHVQQQQDREHQDLQLSWGTSTEASAAAAAFYAATSVAHQPENAQHFAAAALSLADASNLAYSMVSGNPDFVPHHGQHSQSASILSEMQQALQQQQMHLQHQHMIQQQQAQHMLMQQQQQQQAHMIAPASVMGMDPLSAKRSLDATNAMTGGEPAQKKYIRAPPQVRKTQFKGKSSMMETPCKCKTCGGFVGKVCSWRWLLCF